MGVGYPFMAYNLVRDDMTPVVVPNEKYDRALCSEWTNPNGVERQGGRILIEPEPKRVGRPRKA